MTTELQSIRESGWPLAEETWSRLSPYEHSFLAIELGGERTPTWYRHRLTAIDFQNLGLVLDVACGVGQWSAVAAQMNGQVIGVDINSSRLRIAQEINAGMGVSNVSFVHGTMEALPVSDESIDGLFCYGALMFGDIKRTLAEFHRVLKSGGRLYTNANGSGWYMHLLVDRCIKGREYGLARPVLRFILHTIAGRSKERIVSRRWLSKQLSSAGFKIVNLGPEGTTHQNTKEPAPTPAYQPTYYGLPGMIEILAERH